jgi:hypothetical protein
MFIKLLEAGWKLIWNLKTEKPYLHPPAGNGNARDPGRSRQYAENRPEKSLF